MADFGMVTVTRSIIAFVPHAELRKLSTDTPPSLRHSGGKPSSTAAYAPGMDRQPRTARRTSEARSSSSASCTYASRPSVSRMTAACRCRSGRLISPTALGLTSVHVNRTLKSMRNRA